MAEVKEKITKAAAALEAAVHTWSKMVSSKSQVEQFASEQTAEFVQEGNHLQLEEKKQELEKKKSVPKARASSAVQVPVLKSVFDGTYSRMYNRFTSVRAITKQPLQANFS